jgi:hypothetical protein
VWLWQPAAASEQTSCIDKFDKLHIFIEMTEENPDLQRKIVKALNEEIGSDLKQLHKLKELYDETKTIQDDLREKVK